jgi:putative membrane protein insertion efficiency factor
VTLSPLLIGACRFEPSCSRYASEAILRHGARRGCRLALSRLLRCRPFGPRGFDPVP